MRTESMRPRLNCRFLPALVWLSAFAVPVVNGVSSAQELGSDGEYTGADLKAIVGDDTAQRGEMLCALKDSVASGIAAADLADALGPIAGLDRLEALRCLAAKLAVDLSGYDLLLLVGNDPKQRAPMLCALKERVRDGIAAIEIAEALEGLAGLDRLEAVRCLVPRLQQDLGGDALVALLGEEERQRHTIICAVSRRVRPGITAAEVTAALGNLKGLDRLEAVRCIERDRPQAQSEQVPSSEGDESQSVSSSAFGSCGSFGIQLAAGDYLCFGITGSVVRIPGALCAITTITNPPAGAIQPGLELSRPVYFGAACEMHDSCYARAGSIKAQCDSAFLDLMNATCGETLDGEVWSRGRKSCEWTARVGHRAVRGFWGCRSFRAAQSRAGNANASCD